MGMLDRYRKPGGFYQLLSLIETCEPTKQKKFLEIVRQEDPRWADAVRTKMLDMNRIYSWSDETLAEIIGTLQDLTLATAMHGASDAVRNRVYALLSHGRKRKIDDIFETSKPSSGELVSTHLKIIETVRKMAHDGFLRFEKIDPPLHWDEKLEETLLKPSGIIAHAKSIAESPPVPASSSDFRIEYEDGHGPEDSVPHGETADISAEVNMLRKRVNELTKEVAVLRHELSLARGKLEQIKKIA